MSVYPSEIDSDATIIRIDDNLSEIGGQAINQLRTAVFAIETELGTGPSGAKSTVSERLNVSLNPDGTIRASALTSVGLATLPITNTQVATNAGIAEYKLALDHSTSDLNTLITSNTALLNALNVFANEIDSDLATHIAGGSLLSDGSLARHVASHIDINAVGSDPRDPSFSWTGIKDKDGNLRTGANVAAMMQQINDAFTAHQNAVSNAHTASAVTIDTDNFTALPLTLSNVQEFVDYIDDFQQVVVGGHIATQHANAIPLIARPYGCALEDGYKQNVVPPTTCSAYLVRAPSTFPVDDISSGDNIIRFVPDNTGNAFDALFSQVAIGDQLTINYGTGFEATFLIDSLRFVPGSEWVVRINGTNLSDSDVALARIDKPVYDKRTEGILALASANATPTGSFNTFLSSVIVGNPRGAMAIGFGFDSGQLDAQHYNLYLELYPTGNPSDHVIQLPAIDVTGNAGATPGKYTLESVVQVTNNTFREIGYNYRFIAFAENGNFGLMLADAISCASFAIISGLRSSVEALGGPVSVIIESTYTNNVISQFSGGTTFDALGLGVAHADVASPTYSTAYIDEIDAQSPTKVIAPFKRRNYVVNGTVRDNFAPTWNATSDANGDGYWDGYIAARTPVGAFTIETTYEIPLDLKAAGLKSGKTIVVQPTVGFADASYFNIDYGRFIIKNVTFIPGCPGDSDRTQITVINGVHAEGTGFAFSSGPGLNVKIYFSGDSVSFDNEEVINQVPTADPFHRLHEIYVNDSGHTFSHERARMIIQSGGGSNLGTTDWHIRDVSAKLRGYRDTTTSFNKYVRFYVLSYDTTTGEYDGYIGQRDSGGTQIFRTGPITSGRKNVSTRFYDETYVDYIDLIFEEQAILQSSSTDILGGVTPRYVDIELFSSLKNHDENMLLGTVEINWDPPTGQNIVQHVVNRRQFGSIDEEDFTDAAIDFITAVPRATKDNGIIRGFEFDMANASDARELYYKGGVALVNGRIVTTNRQSVTVPEITEDPNAVDSIDWAICVNEGGELIPIIITPTKQEFYAKDNSSGQTYYLVSNTFAELVETRKDLVPINVITADIASFTLGSNADVRRFLTDGNKRELVYSPADYAGTFHSAEAMINWVNQYASSNPLHVKVRGTFDVSSAIDLSSLTRTIVLDGDGAIFNVTANTGLILGSGLTIKNATFNYNPSSPPTYTTDDKINGANGCIYHTSDISNVVIENCEFNSSVTTQRPPFISFELNGTEVLDELRVINNRFNDSGTAPADRQAAIAIVSLNTTGATPALVANTIIEGNICSHKQGIYLTVETDASTNVVAPGLYANNVHITRNNCGAIGFMTTGERSAAALDAAIDRKGGLVIDSNVTNIIATIVNVPSGAGIPGTNYANEQAFVMTVATSTGTVAITRNSANWIHVVSADNSASDEFNETVVSSNRLSSNIDALRDSWGPVFSVENYAISVRAGSLDNNAVTVSGNVITQGYVDSVAYYYTIGIFCSPGSVTNNTVKGIAASGTGINAVQITGRYVVIGNSIFREGRSINYYIQLTSSGGVGGLCVDNIFDDYTTDGASDDETINGTGSGTPASIGDGWTVERNKNQTTRIALGATDGTYTVNTAAVSGSSLASYIEAGHDTLYGSLGLTFHLTDQATDMTYDWFLPAKQLFPAGVSIISARVDHNGTTSVPAQTNDLRIGIWDQTTGTSDISGIVNPNATTTTLSRTFTGTFVNSVTARIHVFVLWEARENSASPRSLFLDNLSVVVRW